MGLAWIFSLLVEHPGLFATLLLLVVFIYVLSSFLSGRPKPGRNPFDAKHVRPPPENIVTDHKARNAVLKQRFKPQKVPENLDAIVIGSGIGGLTTAVLLGRAGQKVLVLEQHDQAGGCCHTFVDKGYEFDTGIHYVGGMTEGETRKIMVDQITEGQVTWVPMDKEYDVVMVGPQSKAKRYSMRGGTREEFASHLEKQFPSEKKAIAEWMRMIDEGPSLLMGVVVPKIIPLKIVKILMKTHLFDLLFRNYLKWCGMTLREALDKMSDNEEFKNVLSYAFGDIGLPPSQLGIVGYLALMNHYSKGAFYPLGGPSEIAFQIIPIIERYGGRVLVDAQVTKILTDQTGKANGITVHKSGGDVNIYAKTIVSDAGVINTFKYLLPQSIAEKSPIYPLIEKIGPSISSLTIFVGINGDSEELNLPASNIWAFTGEDFEQCLNAYTSLTLEEAADSKCPLLFASFPSAKDPSWAQKYKGKSAALLITLVPWSWFTQWQEGKLKRRGEDYDALKEKIGRQMWKQTEELFPQLSGKLDYIDIGTPLSNKHYLGQPEGEMYGLAHGIARFQPKIAVHLRPDSGIPGLYLTGQDIINAGFVPSLNAGVLTAGTILHRNLFKDVAALPKDITIKSPDKENKAD